MLHGYFLVCIGSIVAAVLHIKFHLHTFVMKYMYNGHVDLEQAISKVQASIIHDKISKNEITNKKQPKQIKAVKYKYKYIIAHVCILMY